MTGTDMDNKLKRTFLQTKNIQEDWRDWKSFAGCAKYLFETQMMSDVTFTFKKYGARKLQAHRLILSLRSSVFEAMFLGPMTDSRDEIDIEGVEPNIFNLMLRYIYTDKADLNGDTTYKCMSVARMYCLQGLEKACSSFLENSLSIDNVCSVYEESKMCSDVELEQKCYTYIIENAEEVFKSDDVRKLSYKSFWMIMSDEGLQSEEILHFEVAVKWANEKCKSENIEPSSENKRKVLGQVLELIRFPTIPPEVFAEIVVPSKILLAEEQLKLLQFMVCRSTQSPGYVGNFISLPRKDTSHVLNLGSVCTLSTYTTCGFVVKIRSNYDIALLSATRFATNIIALAIVCKEDPNLNKVILARDFACSDGTIDFRSSCNSPVILANKNYTLTFNKNSKVCPVITIRKVCHVTCFGELSINFEAMPDLLETVTFKRV